MEGVYRRTARLLVCMYVQAPGFKPFSYIPAMLEAYYNSCWKPSGHRFFQQGGANLLINFA